MTELVSATGGNLFSFISSDVHGAPLRPYAEEADWISKNLSALAQQMDRYNRVEFRLPAPVDKPRDWKLEVVGENGKPRRDVTVLYPHKLVPCGSVEKNH